MGFPLEHYVAKAERKNTDELPEELDVSCLICKAAIVEYSMGEWDNGEAVYILFCSEGHPNIEVT